MSLVGYVAEDGLIEHQWENRPLVLRRLYVPGHGGGFQDQEVVVDKLGSRVGEGKGTLGMAFEM